MDERYSKQITVEDFNKKYNFKRQKDVLLSELHNCCSNCEHSTARYSDWCKFTRHPVAFDGICDLWEKLKHKKPEYRGFAF